MNFDLSEEQELLQQTVSQLLGDLCPPTRIREIYEEARSFDADLWARLSELGLAGIATPEAFGGAGLEILDLAVVAETLGYHATPSPYLSHSVASHAIALSGSDAQKARWLPRLAAGESIATFAATDGDDGWDPSDWTLKAEGNLSGKKRFVPFAMEADVIVVGLEGGRLGLVERGASGLTIEPFDGVDRTRSLDHLAFDDTPWEELPNTATASRRVRDLGLVLLAADAFGGASRLVEMSVDYAKSREQFGVTIGHFQAVKHQLASMAVEVEPSRGLYWYAAHAMDHFPEESERTAAIAKAHLTDRFIQTARDAVEIHGGIGFTWECDVQIWFKRAMFDRTYLGAPSAHRERAAQLADW